MAPVMFRNWRCRWSNPTRNRGCELQEMQARTGEQMPSTQRLVCAYDGNDTRLPLCTLIGAAVSPNINPAFDAVPPATTRQSNCEIRGKSKIWSSSQPHFPSNAPIQAAKLWNLLTKRCQSPPVASRSGSVRVLRSSAPEQLKTYIPCSFRPWTTSKIITASSTSTLKHLMKNFANVIHVRTSTQMPTKPWNFIMGLFSICRNNAAEGWVHITLATFSPHC